MERLFVKLLVIFWLYCVSGEDGYLVANNTLWFPTCEEPLTDVCAIKNRTVDIHNMPNIRKDVAKNVTEMLDRLKQFNLTANATCKSAVVDYHCADIQTCDGTTYGVDIVRKKKACVNRQACSQEVKTNMSMSDWQCENITAKTHKISFCIDIPDTKNDVCPKRGYKILDFVRFYYAKTIEKWLTKELKELKAKPNVSSSCVQTYTNLTCYVIAGSVCSQDGRLMIHIMNRDECRKAMEKVCPPAVVAQFVIDTCNTLPLSNVTRAPLPPGIDAKTILNGASGDGKDNGTDGGIKNGMTRVGLVVVVYTILFIIP